jgi:hypothetical protein
MSGECALPARPKRGLNKNPSSLSRIRTPDRSACTGFLSIPSNSSDKTAPDAPPRAALQTPASLLA